MLCIGFCFTNWKTAGRSCIVLNFLVCILCIHLILCKKLVIVWTENKVENLFYQYLVVEIKMAYNFLLSFWVSICAGNTETLLHIYVAVCFDFLLLFYLAVCVNYINCEMIVWRPESHFLLPVFSLPHAILLRYPWLGFFLSGFVISSHKITQKLTTDVWMPHKVSD